MSITLTPSGSKVPEEKLTARIKRVREVEDFRLEQLGKDFYRILILPVKNFDGRSIKGSVLDALVDLYGINANYEIDIDEFDEVLLPEGERAQIKFTASL